MKKLFALLLAVLMLLSFAACGQDTSGETPETAAKNEEPAETKATAASKGEIVINDPGAVLDEITKDFETVTTQLTQKLEKTFEDVGTTYKDYQKNKGLVDEWVALAISESEALFARTKENSVTYFKMIAEDPDCKYSEFCDEATEKYYDVVCDDAISVYEEAICDAAMDALKAAYYNGIIDEADLEYEEWEQASNESYATWERACDTTYAMWCDIDDYTYGLYDAIEEAFCDEENFNVDAIVAALEKELAEEGTEEAETAYYLEVLTRVNEKLLAVTQ